MRANALRLKWLLIAADLLLPQRGWAVPPPASAYAEIPTVETARMSPDGRLVAYIDGREDDPLVRIAPIDGDQEVTLSSSTSTPDWVEWKDDQTLLVSVLQMQTDAGGLDYGASWLNVLTADGKRAGTIRLNARINLFGAPFNDAPDFPGLIPNVQDRVVSNLPGQRMQLLMQFGDRVADRPEVYRVDLWDDEKQLVVRNRPEVTGWVADQNGAVRAGFTSEETDQVGVFARHILARRSAHGVWHSLPFQAGDLAFSATDPGVLYALLEPGNSDGSIVEIDIASGAITRILARAPEGRLSLVADNGVMVGYRIGDDAGEHTIYIDPVRAATAGAIEAALKVSDVQLVDISTDRKRVMALVKRPDRPAALWLLDRGEKPAVLNPLVDDYEGVPADQVAPVRWVSFAARDGLVIPARLTLPVNAPQRPIGFVVLPHGGPFAHDEPGFDWLAQFMASRGWGVIQPQFRGSTGYGWRFEASGKRQWGLAMQDDVTDATRWLVKEKLADPGRICIVGESYGGYAALEGAEKEPALYACAAAIAAPSDLPAMLDEATNFAFSDSYHVDVGDPGALAAVSPALHADRIRIPILLVQGRKDYTVPDTQTEEMAGALLQAGKTEQTIYLPEGDHYLSRRADRLVVLNALDGFLGKYLGGG